MVRNNKKLIMLIACLFIFFLFTSIACAQFSDISGHWAEAEIQKWASKDVIKGKPTGEFKPEDYVTRAEFTAVMDRVFGYKEKTSRTFPDVSGKEWYADSVSRAVAAGIITGDGDTGKFRPNDNITRQEAVVILSRAFNLKANNTDSLKKFVDAKDIASWSKEAVAALVEKGYISGRPGNIFAPKDNLTRSEMIKLLDNIAGDLKNKEGTYTGNIDGNLVISASSVVLKDMVIDGDLYLAEGIGEGEVTLDNVTVKGRTVVRGGGENSIIIKNSSLKGTLLVIKKDGKVRIVAKGTTEIANVTLKSGAKLQEEELTGKGFEKVEIIEVPANGSVVLEGDFVNVTIASPGVSVEIAGGNIENLNIDENAKSAKVNVDEKSKVGTLTVNADAKIEGKGTIETANINSENVEIEQKPAKINIKEGVKAIVGGEEVDSEKTPTTGGGGSGGGGGVPQTKTIKISEAKLNFADGSSLPFDNPQYTAYLIDREPADKISSVSFKTNIESSKFILNSINSPNTGLITLNKDVKDFSTGDIKLTLEDIVGSKIVDGRDGITVYTLKEFFGKKVDLVCTLKGTGSYSGYGSKSATISIIFSDDEIEIEPISHSTEWADITVQKVSDQDVAYIITAKIREDKMGDKVSEIGISNLLTSSFGVLPSEVKAGDAGEWFKVATQKSEIADAIAKLSGPDKTWADLTLGDLTGENIYFKKSGDNDTIYKIMIAK